MCCVSLGEPRGCSGNPRAHLDTCYSTHCCVFGTAQAKHANEAKCTWGIDGTTGVMTDMKELGIWEPYSVKTQTYKTAVEVRPCVGCAFVWSMLSSEVFAGMKRLWAVVVSLADGKILRFRSYLVVVMGRPIRYTFRAVIVSRRK